MYIGVTVTIKSRGTGITFTYAKVDNIIRPTRVTAQIVPIIKFPILAEPQQSILSINKIDGITLLHIVQREKASEL